MTARLQHRGPDAEGHRFETQGSSCLGLGHRRLSIIDLSSLANQPLSNEDNTIHVVFNGEIYNYRALRDRLCAAGHVFRTQSDTEVLVHLYEETGEAMCGELEGMFAFAIWDSTRRKMFVARDRIGIKPVFYMPIEQGIAFSSELKSLLELPRAVRELDPSSVDAYMTFGYVPGPQTIFKGICALPPGQWLTWHDGNIRTGRYWSPADIGAHHDSTVSELTEQLDSLLNEAVRSHLVSDVPVGAFLSGGVDSSLVAAIARRHMGEPLHTFTIGFPGGVDERRYARIVADHIGSVHHEREAEPRLADYLPAFVWHLDQPLYDNSVLPAFLVSALAREHGKVVLSGDGGDEPFAGYGWTRAAAGIPGLGLPLRPFGWKWLYRTGAAGLLCRGLFDVTHDAAGRYVRRMTTTRDFRTWLYRREFRARLHGDPADVLRNSIGNLAVRDTRERYPLTDLMTYLHEDVLFKVDRMSMANSLEVRVPLLDHRLVEWALRLPWNLRATRMHGKVLLRRVAERYLPSEILTPRKQGFSAPVGQWIRGPLGDVVKEVFLSQAFAQRGIVDPARACRLVNMHRGKGFDLGHRIWALLVFEIWCRIWLDGEDWHQSITGLVR